VSRSLRQAQIRRALGSCGPQMEADLPGSRLQSFARHDRHHSVCSGRRLLLPAAIPMHNELLIPHPDHGLPGRLKVGGVNPLFPPTPPVKLKGQGQISVLPDCKPAFGQVIAVLPMQPGRELNVKCFSITRRENCDGSRPLQAGDVSPNNVILSTRSPTWKIELKERCRV